MRPNTSSASLKSEEEVYFIKQEIENLETLEEINEVRNFRLILKRMALVATLVLLVIAVKLIFGAINDARPTYSVNHQQVGVGDDFMDKVAVVNFTREIVEINETIIVANITVN